MDDKKEKTGFWQSWMTVTTLLAVTLMIIWFNSQSPSIRSESDENISIGNGTRAPIGNGTGVKIWNNAGAQTGKDANVQVENSTIVPMDNDTFFRTWIAMSFKAINENLDCIYKAGGVRNIVGIEICAKLLGDNANISLRHMNEGVNTSISMRPVSDEYKKALEDYNIGGYGLETGARNKNDSQMDDAIGRIQDGTVHIKLVDKMLTGNNTTGEKFVRSQQGVNTT